MGRQEELWRGANLGFSFRRLEKRELLVGGARLQGDLQRSEGPLHFPVHCRSRWTVLIRTRRELDRAPCLQELTAAVGLVQDLRFDDLLDDIFQGNQAQHLVERVSLPLVVHLLDDGHVRVA